MNYFPILSNVVYIPVESIPFFQHFQYPYPAHQQQSLQTHPVNPGETTPAPHQIPNTKGEPGLYNQANKAHRVSVLPQAATIQIGIHEHITPFPPPLPFPMPSPPAPHTSPYAVTHSHDETVYPAQVLDDFKRSLLEKIYGNLSYIKECCKKDTFDQIAVVSGLKKCLEFLGNLQNKQLLPPPSVVVKSPYASSPREHVLKTVLTSQGMLVAYEQGQSHTGFDRLEIVYSMLNFALAYLSPCLEMAPVEPIQMNPPANAASSQSSASSSRRRPSSKVTKKEDKEGNGYRVKDITYYTPDQVKGVNGKKGAKKVRFDAVDKSH